MHLAPQLETPLELGCAKRTFDVQIVKESCLRDLTLEALAALPEFDAGAVGRPFAVSCRYDYGRLHDIHEHCEFALRVMSRSSYASDVPIHSIAAEWRGIAALALSAVVGDALLHQAVYKIPGVQPRPRMRFENNTKIFCFSGGIILKAMTSLRDIDPHGPEMAKRVTARYLVALHSELSAHATLAAMARAQGLLEEDVSDALHLGAGVTPATTRIRHTIRLIPA